MANNSFKEQYDRHQQLLGLLRSNDYWKSSQLAEHLGVSLRTLMRDLEGLRDAGYPIEADRGRGGGIRLSGRWGIERLALSHSEVIELILALAILEKMNSPLFSSQLKSIRLKIANIFPQQQQKSISAIRNRILVGDQASSQVISSYNTPSKIVSNRVIECFLEKTMIDIGYRSEAQTLTERRIEPQYIVLNWPVWYLLAWDHLRQAERLFRIDRIQRIKSTGLPFKMRKKTEFEPLYEAYFKPL